MTEALIGAGAAAAVLVLGVIFKFFLDRQKAAMDAAKSQLERNDAHWQALLDELKEGYNERIGTIERSAEKLVERFASVEGQLRESLGREIDCQRRLASAEGRLSLLEGQKT